MDMEMAHKTRAGRDLGPLVGVAKQHLEGMGSRLGFCIEEGKGRIMSHISKLRIKPTEFGREWPPKFERLDRVAQSLCTGFWGWRHGLQQMGEERRAAFSQVLMRISRPQWRPQRLQCASLSMAAQEIGSQLDDPKPLYQLAMSTEQVSKRLDGVPVYTVSNSANEFILISDVNSQKSLGIFCFRQQDAEALLSQVRDREPSLGRGAKVVAVSLDKVYQLSTEGIAFRFLPDPRQVKNALESTSKSGETRKAFDGVPVFQSDNLILRSNNRRFCPIFFCKEDLDRALSRAFKQQQRVNPALKVNSDIQVGSFEDVLKRMESNEEDTGWGDIVFIPPGIDAFSHLGKGIAQGSGRETAVG
ncbi:unnamed protein product [Calypogeia fissa]